MKFSIIMALLAFIGSTVLADWVVKCATGNPAVVSVTGDSVDKISGASYVSATGGTITNYTEGGTNWTAHIFTNTAATSLVVTVGGSVEVLIVGGGGWSVSIGGGGAGERSGGSGGNGGSGIVIIRWVR
jgi:hypothetical protein